MRNEEPMVPAAPLLVIGHWALGRVYNLIGSRQSAVGRGRVASRKSQVVSYIACGDVISYWLLVYWEEALRFASRIVIGHWALGSAFGALLSFAVRRLTFVRQEALQSNAYQNSSFLIPHSSFLIKTLPTTHYPLPTLFERNF